MKKILLLSILLFLSACSQGDKPVIPEPTEMPPTATALPTPTDIPAEPTALPEPTAEPEPAAFEWPAPMAAEEAFSRTGVTTDEQATFDLMAQANYEANDPVALAIAISGAPQPEPPPEEPAALTEGMTRKFWVHNQDTLEWFQIEARLLKITEHGYFWFDTTRDPKPEDVQRAADGFEMFYQATRDIYGQEPSPGIDGDPRIYLLHSSALALCNVDESTAHQCGILGYFSTTDTLPSEINEHSNEHEMFVLNIDVAIGSTSYISTLVHEFRHMIEHSYDRHDDDWEVEGTAVMAQMIVGDDSELRIRANGYMDNTDIQMNAWTQGASNPHYGKGYVFSRYIFDRFGTEFYSTWVQHPDRAFFAIDAVLDQYGYDFSALDLWQDFTAAVALIGIADAPADFAFGETFSANEPSSTNFSRFPSETGDTVNQFGIDLYKLYNVEPATLRFTGSTRTSVFANVLPASGSFMWYSGRANQSDMSLTREVDLTGVDSATLNYAIHFSIENGYDFGYVLVSTDGGLTWEAQAAEGMGGESTRDDPSELALADRFYSGRSREWTQESIDLTPYAGQVVLVRFQYITDAIFTAPGFVLDNISIPEIGYFDDVESGAEGWTADGFLRVTAYMPQQFALSLVTFEDGAPVVQRIEIAADNTAEISVPAGTAETRPILIVTATNPLILTPAEYVIQANP